MTLAWVYTGADVGDESLTGIEIVTDPFYRGVDEALLKKDFLSANLRDARSGSSEVHPLIDALVMRLSHDIKTKANIGHRYRRNIMRDFCSICEAIRKPFVPPPITSKVLNEDCLASSASDDDVFPGAPPDEDGASDTVLSEGQVIDDAAKLKNDAGKETDHGAGEVREERPEILEEIVDLIAKKTAEKTLEKLPGKYPRKNLKEDLAEDFRKCLGADLRDCKSHEEE